MSGLEEISLMGEGKVREKNRKDSLELTKLYILDLYRTASSPISSTHLSDILTPLLPILKNLKVGGDQDGGVGGAELSSPHAHIKNTSACGTVLTEAT